jgi:hypothetical protein
MNKKVLNYVILGILLFSILVPLVNSKLPEEHVNNTIMDYKANRTQNNEIASVSINRYDPQKREFSSDIIRNLSVNEAYQIRDELIDINEKYINDNEDKIRCQFELLQNWEIIPKELKFDDLLIVLERLKELRGYEEDPENIRSGEIITPGVTIAGPSIISYFGIGGISYPLHLFIPGILEPIIMERLFGDIIYYEDILYNTSLDTSLDGWFGVGPVYVPISSTSAFITVTGVVISGPSYVFSPYFAIQVPYIGFSIDVSIMNDIYPVDIFDWVIVVGLLGAVVYLE